MNTSKNSFSPRDSYRPFTGRLAPGIGILVVAGLFLAGCKSTSPPRMAQDDENFQEWRQVAAESGQSAPPMLPLPEMRDFYRTPPSEADAVAVDTVARPDLPTISVTDLVLTHEMDVAVLLRALADAADLNVLIGERVTGPVLVSLRRETRWDRIFLALIEAHGLHYELEEDLLRILSREDIERRIAMERALHEQLLAAELRSGSEPTTVETFRVRYADPERLADSIRDSLQGVARRPGGAETVETASANGQRQNRFVIKADSDSNLLIVHAVPADIERVRGLIQGMDQPTHQILIEANIVQASSDIARELGFQWGAFHSARDGRLLWGTTPQADGFNSNFPAGFDPQDAGFIAGVQRINQSEVLQAQLSAMQRDGLLNIVSTPSITTLDRQTAIIESGEERPFVSAVGTGLAAFPQIEFKRAVLRLEVTPQVIDENWVKLVIDTTKDEFDDAQAVIIEGTLQVPIITRSALTTLYLADGQTTVIGGLSSETRSETETGIPILKDIPGLGFFFRNSTTRTALNDTLIFITPRIVPPSNNANGAGPDVEDSES